MPTWTPPPQLLAIIKANSPKKDTFISVEQCVWGPNYLAHPSYAFMNRLCPAAVSKWPAVTTGCPVSDWSTWSPCDSNCGPGTSYVALPASRLSDRASVVRPSPLHPSR